MESSSRPHRGDHAAKHTHDGVLTRAHAVIQSFDSASYTATITLSRGPDASLAGVPVSRAIPGNLVVAGATAAVLFFDHSNSADAMVVGVY